MIDFEISGLSDGPLWVSRALEPELRDGLVADFAAEELPILRGKTAVPASLAGTAILGHPNYLGRFEDPSPCDTLWIPGPWSNGRSLPPGSQLATPVVKHPTDDPKRAVERARLLAKRLRQLAGVELLAMPETPVFVFITAFPPPAELHAVAGMRILGSRFPELPGAVRAELPPDVTDERFDRYAAATVRVITEGM